MTYQRISDIKTPPFAYVANREQAIHACPLCLMPYPHVKEPLKVEIFTTEVANWEREIAGQPLMAEHWLIGDEQFVAELRKSLGSVFTTQPVQIVSWLSRSQAALKAGSSARQAHSLNKVPPFLLVTPKESISLDRSLIDRFPPIRCHACQRDIPDIPFDVPLVPDESVAQPAFAFLGDIHYEGYDYMVRSDRAQALIELFPSLIMEPLEPGEPSLF